MASSDLLKQIQAGKRLKKAETNDRSAPVVETPKSSVGGGLSRPPASPAKSITVGDGGPPQLGGLFAGGMPKLKPAGQSTFAKPPTLGKPPSIPTAPPPPPGRSDTSSKPSISAPRPPNRLAPGLPSRTIPDPPASSPSPPRRAPPPVRNMTPPVSPAPPYPSSPDLPARSISPLRSASSSISRPVPAVPPRSSLQSAHVPSRNVPAPPTMPGRAPPPPPRPSSTGPALPARAVPPPPTRKAPNGSTPPTPPPRVRAVSEAEPSSPPLPRHAHQSGLVLPIPPASSRARTASFGSAPPSALNRRTSAGNGLLDRVGLSTPRFPSPPPNAGSHTFPVADFPPPRAFKPITRQYGGGRQRGSDFDLRALE